MSDQSGRYPYLWGVSQQGQVSELHVTSESEQVLPISFTFRKVKDHMRECRFKLHKLKKRKLVKVPDEETKRNASSPLSQYILS